MSARYSLAVQESERMCSVRVGDALTKSTKSSAVSLGAIVRAEVVKVEAAGKVKSRLKPGR